MNWYMRSINVTTSHSCINTQIYLVLTHLNWFHLQIRTFSIEFVLLKIINLLILILILFSMKNMLEKIIFYLILIFFRIIIYYLNNSNSEDDLVSFMKPNNLDFSCIQILRSRFCSSSGPLKYSNFFFLFGMEDFNFQSQTRGRVIFQERVNDVAEKLMTNEMIGAYLVRCRGSQTRWHAQWQAPILAMPIFVIFLFIEI